MVAANQFAQLLPPNEISDALSCASYGLSVPSWYIVFFFKLLYEKNHENF